MALPGATPPAVPSPSPSPRPPARTAATRPEGSLPAPAGTAPETPAGAPAEPLTAAATHEGELPVVPVTDLVVHGDDLVVSTQGRGFWVLDDVSPLRQMAAEVAGEDAHLFRPRTASRYLTPEAPPGTGKNPPAGAVLYYWLRAEPKDKEEIALEVLDSAGHVVRRLTNKPEPREEGAASEGEDDDRDAGAKVLPAKAGLNRFVWDLRSADASKFKGKTCRGCYVIVTDRQAIRPVRMGVSVVWQLRRIYGDKFEIDKVNRLLKNDKTMAAIKSATNPTTIPAVWKDDLVAFEKVRKKHLLYP